MSIAASIVRPVSSSVATSASGVGGVGGIPALAIQDRAGNYVQDRTGNYIVSRV